MDPGELPRENDGWNAFPRETADPEESLSHTRKTTRHVVHALSYAARIPVISRYFGRLCVVAAVLIVVPLLVCLLYGDVSTAVRYAIVAAGVFLLGMLLSRIPGPDDVQTNEAMVVAAMIFLFTPLSLTWPAMAAGLSFQDALFETVSGVTTTGLTTVGSVSAMPPTFLFARAWMQWIGGLGIVVLSLAVMIRPGRAAKRMGDLEDYETDLVGGTRANARRVLGVYAVLTGSAVLLLGVVGGGGLEAVLYAFAAVSTGGFSPHDASMAGLRGPWTQAVLIFFSTAGAVSLISYYRIRREGWRALPRDRQLGLMLGLACSASLLLALIFWRNGAGPWQALRHGALNAFSAQTTTGFASVDLAGGGTAAKLVLLFSMFVGGGIGSTAGGIKILRLMIVLRVLQLLIRKTSEPRRAVTDVRVGGERLDPEEIQNALGLVVLFVGVAFLSWVPFVAAGKDPVDSLFEVVSALGTVGLSTGITRAGLHPLLKAVLCADMLLGRLEILAWLVLLYPGTWAGRKRRA